MIVCRYRVFCYKGLIIVTVWIREVQIELESFFGVKIQKIKISENIFVVKSDGLATKDLWLLFTIYTVHTYLFIYDNRRDI